MSRKLVISPEQDVDTFSNWIKPTRPTNADLVTSTSIATSPSRNSTEGIIKQRLQGWPVCHQSQSGTAIIRLSSAANIIQSLPLGHSGICFRSQTEGTDTCVQDRISRV